MNKLQIYLKPVLQKLGTNPSGLGFQVKKSDCDKFESWKFLKVFPYPCLGFFHQNHPLVASEQKLEVAIKIIILQFSLQVQGL